MNDTQLRDQEKAGQENDFRASLTTREIAGGVAAKPAQEQKRPEREGDAQVKTGPEEVTPLFDQAETEDFRSQWKSIQTKFIDDPRNCVERADELVARTVKRLAEIFAAERENLEHSWDRGENVSTEDLRIAVQRYRAFFDRLLSV